jgi:nitroimidazol reductase NimA-like FMN-containing flavoprotein (pyridoxamine 5'-phosphate oxidase superfamily)
MDCMSAVARSLESLSTREAIRLLSTAAVGRVAFTVGGLPVIVPVTFAVFDNAVVMRTADDTRLASAADGGVLAIEADEVEPTTRTGWSVVVTGTAEVVVDRLEQARIHSVVEPFAPGTHDVHIRLPLTSVSGRRVVTVAG